MVVKFFAIICLNRFWIAIGETILTKGIQYIFSTFAVKGKDMYKLCVMVNEIYCPFVLLCCAGTGAVSKVHQIDFKQREKCLSLERLYHRFYSACYCFLFLMKSAHFHKYVHNFLIYLSVVFCDPVHFDLSSSMCNSVVGKG